jgi:tRNA(adenine34) deaminase
MKEQRAFTSFMDAAFAQARAAGARGEVPVGAVLVLGGEVLAQAGNRTRELSDPTAHAEMLVIREACAKMGAERLVGADLYVTLEPCAMCASAIAAARVGRLYFGAADPKSGGVMVGARVFSHPQCHHAPQVYDGIGAGDSEALLRAFFAAKR